MTSLAALALTTSAATARADDADGPYFYKGHDYGSQALYGPLYVYLNRGFDVLQLRATGRDVRTVVYRGDFANVVDNLRHPIRAIEETGGAWRFLRQEVFPFSYTIDTARWGPNYFLHLIGGGQTYRALWEWYDANGVPAPALFSMLTTFAAQLTNETLENKGVKGPNTDAIADLYIFDVGGILLFSLPSVARFFSRTIVVSDWSLQPTFRVPSTEIHNQGNYYAMRWALPFYERLRLFGYFGFSNMGGLSFNVKDGYAVTLAGGGKIDAFYNKNYGTNLNQAENVIRNEPAAAVFVDRNESLLASLEVANVADYFIHLNVYPGAIEKVNPGVGGFVAVARDGRVMGGVCLARPFGFGLSGGNL